MDATQIQECALRAVETTPGITVPAAIERVMRETYVTEREARHAVEYLLEVGDVYYDVMLQLHPRRDKGAGR